jgi:hypothetical protein
MSGSRLYLTLGITIAAVAFGGWRMLLPGADTTSSGASGGVSALLSTTLNAAFTGAEASLDAQRNATGSYAGATVQAPVTLVRADVSSYCLELDKGAIVQHVAGPGGSAQPGPC